MKFRLGFTPCAARELEEQYTWYELQRRGLGDEYFASTNDTLSVIRHPEPLSNRSSKDTAGAGGQIPIRNLLYGLDVGRHCSRYRPWTSESKGVATEPRITLHSTGREDRRRQSNRGVVVAAGY